METYKGGGASLQVFRNPEVRAVDLAREVGEVLPEPGLLPTSPEGRWGLGTGTEITQAQEPGGTGTQGAQALRLPLLGEVRGLAGQVVRGPPGSHRLPFPSFSRGEAACLPPPQQTLLEVGVIREGKGTTTQADAQQESWGGFPAVESLSARRLVIRLLPLCFWFLFSNINQPAAAWPLFSASMSQAELLSPSAFTRSASS